MARPVGSVPTRIRDVTRRVRVLSTATVPRAGLSGKVELTTSAAGPLLLSASGPAFRSVACGKMRVIGTKARSLPFATLTTDTPPSPLTHARLPPGANAIDMSGPDRPTVILRTTFCRRVLTTQIRPETALPTQTEWPPRVTAAVCAPAPSLILFTTLALLGRTTTTWRELPPAASSVTYAN